MKVGRWPKWRISPSQMLTDLGMVTIGEWERRNDPFFLLAEDD
jgi:hypothetical protein